MTLRKGFYCFRIVFVCLSLLLLSSVAFAQGSATPIQIGQNTPGSLTPEVPVAQFALTAAGGESAIVQVLALSPGFAPRFQVLNPAGVEILSVSNHSAQATLVGNATFADAGVYTIVVSGENGSTGQFVLALQAGASLPPPIPLPLDQQIAGSVDSLTPVQVYRFSTSSLNPAALSILSQSPISGLLVSLYDESAGKTIATHDASVIGVAYQLPAADRTYRVELRASGAGDTAFSICAGACAGAPSTGSGGATLAPAVEAPPLTVPTAASAACTASSGASGAANLRTGPGTQYAALGSLPLGQSAQVLSEWTGGQWYEINAGSQTLWVAASVVTLAGDCAALPKVAAPTNAQLAATPTPTITPTPPATATPLASSTPTATLTPTATNTLEPLPDLAVQGMTITQDSPTHARVTFDVFNRGTVDVTQPFYVYVCITVLCVEKQVTLSVRAGSATNVFVDLDHPTSTQLETVAVAVDSRGEIRELSEDNNITSLADVSLSFY